ncbi:hypothetical protein [Streptomyces botrytidirepellens]|uniref:Uncharacterized protein n=1 Tax=Streptomyces botrytidirepellens TaxID=2486417 RepID=A0A3M8VA35_9ACTN|nr:hypothetical protein [Streptomyces botrytidirepellens]RNG13819.1 hypothetical protein EEJ42_31645 [Streptomyces botrytidirepellens]
MNTTARSILRDMDNTTPDFTRYTPTNSKRPEGPDYGVDGWLFTLPSESIGPTRFETGTYAAYQISTHGMLVWQVREVGGQRRQVGSHSTSRKGAVAFAVGAVAKEREKTAAPATQDRRPRARGAAWRLAAPSAAGVHTAPTTEERLRQAHAGWEATRPHTAEIRLAYPLAGGGASLRLYDQDGRECREPIRLTERGAAGRQHDPAGTYLDTLTDGAMTQGLLIAAGWHLAQLGYNYAPHAKWAPYTGREFEREQWAQWSKALPEEPLTPAMARVDLVMTREHRAYREALYGPAPELPALPAGMTAHPTQRGRWTVCLENRLFLTLSWQPLMGGQRWRIWTSPNATKLHSTHHSAPEAIKALSALFAETDAKRAARRAEREQ